MTDAELQPRPWRVAASAFLNGYAQIFFSRSPWVGLLLLGATLWEPRAAAYGALSVAIALTVARALSFSLDNIASGLFSYNALLVGLGTAMSFEPATSTLALLVVTSVGSVLLTAAVHSALGSAFNLPALTVPFLMAFFLALGAAPLLGVPLATPGVPTAVETTLPPPLTTFLQSLGAIFFLPRVEVGAMVLAALLLHSRFGTLLAVVGFAGAYVLGADVLVHPDSGVLVALGYNFLLTALALGGVFFVPSPTSLLLALAGVAVCGLITIGGLPYLARVGLPLAILPFNLTVLLFLYAMRQRMRDAHPASVGLTQDNPEENLHYYRTRIARFGARYAVRLGAPVMSRWIVTQGTDGQETHRGLWRHALDLEVADPDGSLCRGTGRALEDYLCYHLPVVAPADATIVRVIDGVPDNSVGEVNLRDNWGNLVLMHHGYGLYSLVAHLSPGTVSVVEGQVVRRGDELGKCGNSGRSATPHLHFQLQASPRIGAATLPMELHDVFVSRDTDAQDAHERLQPAATPREGDVIRNIDGQSDLRARFQTPHREVSLWQVSEAGADEDDVPAWEERVVAGIDLYGNRYLRSLDRRATLYFDHDDQLYTTWDVVGARCSALALLRLALPRIPFEAGPGLEWSDRLPRRAVASVPSRLLLELVAPFWPSASDFEMRYQAHREGTRLIVEGRAVDRPGAPTLKTRAELTRAAGVQRVEVTLANRSFRATRTPETDQPADALVFTPARPTSLNPDSPRERSFVA